MGMPGTFVLSLHGMMHAQNFRKRTFLSLPDPPINVGLGGKVDPSQLDPDPDKPAKPSAQPYDRPAVFLIKDVPTLTAFFPSLYAPFGKDAYVPNAGFYPFAEIGLLTFDDKDNVSGTLRVNTDGFFGEPGDVSGGYGLDKAGASGVFSLQFKDQSFANHIWDYHFIRVTHDELVVVTGGRLPRPAAGSGTMRRVAGDLN